ncbi:MAG TPA: YkvA family protein [Xanthomonadales bacterium]|nr:YkvA family protein [Xanthomonadales bacterium]
METSAIEALIAQQYAESHAESELHELLAVVAERSGKQATDADLQRASHFVQGYIELVPYMMKVAWTAASNVGLEDQMQRVLAMVQSYWKQQDDIIPDYLGIIGLLDDAYCSLSSLQTVSDHFQLQSGKYLFPDDLSDANKAMRKIIGEPYATDLDRLVIRTMQESQLMESLKKMSSAEKQLNFSNQSTIWNHGPAGKMDLQDLAGLGLID